MTKRGTLRFAASEVFEIHVVVGINLTAQHDLCASTVHHSSHIHHHHLSPNSPTPDGLWYKHSPLRKAKHHRTWHVRVTYHVRTAIVRSILEKPHDDTCILNRERVHCCAENAESRSMFFARTCISRCILCCSSRCPRNDVPVTSYQVVGNIRTMIRYKGPLRDVFDVKSRG